jgi:hypothetical protein
MVRFILARDKKTGEPIRFATFKGPHSHTS